MTGLPVTQKPRFKAHVGVLSDLGREATTQLCEFEDQGGYNFTNLSTLVFVPTREAWLVEFGIWGDVDAPPLMQDRLDRPVRIRPPDNVSFVPGSINVELKSVNAADFFRQVADVGRPKTPGQERIAEILTPNSFMAKRDEKRRLKETLDLLRDLQDG